MFPAPQKLSFQNHAQKCQKHLKEMKSGGGVGWTQLVIPTTFRVGSHPSAHTASGKRHHSKRRVQPRPPRRRDVGWGTGPEQRCSDGSEVHQHNLFQPLTLSAGVWRKLVLVGKQEQTSDGCTRPFVSDALNSSAGVTDRYLVPGTWVHTARPGQAGFWETSDTLPEELGCKAEGVPVAHTFLSVVPHTLVYLLPPAMGT